MKIRIDESKKIKFGYQTENVDPSHVRGCIRLIIEGIEYGFPVETIDGIMIAVIPPLESFVKEEILRGQGEIGIKLEVVALDTCCCLWEDMVEVEKPIKVYATVQEIETIEETSKPKIKLDVVKEERPGGAPDRVLPEDKQPKKTSKFRKKLIS